MQPAVAHTDNDPDPAGQVDFEALAKRLGPAHIEKRLVAQTACAARIYGGGRVKWHFENMTFLHRLLAAGLVTTGLRGRARRNAMRPVVRYHAVAIPRLPASFDGYRILHLSDLHCDADDAFMPELIERVRGVEHDVCLLTGDYRMQTFGSYRRSALAMRQLRDALSTPMLAVLGNHDYLEMTAALESIGIRVLLNEAVSILKEAGRLWIAGVDDAHFYETDDLEKAARDIPPEEPSVLMAHSPDLYAEAARKGFDLMLCGHTHGGQMCLPGGFMVIRNSRCRRRYCNGRWQYKTLTGYTSRGTGSSGLAARLNCPAEIVVHILKKGA